MSGATEVLILFGSNVEPERHCVAAAEALASVLDDLQLSSAWRSRAVGTDAAPFVNWAARGTTDLGPTELKFDCLRAIEESFGRVRSADVNAPRTVDLDLLLYGELVLRDANAGIDIPDPDFIRHAYAILPAAEVAAELPVPGDGRTVTELVARVDGTGLERLDSIFETASG